jgi:branched-chain amino acid transport system permease protein
MNNTGRTGIPLQVWAGVALVAIALGVLPFVAALAGQAWVRILNFAMVYTMLALGLNIVVGFAGLLDLGYIAFYAVGAYTYALLASPQFGIHLPFWVILPIGAGIACLFGVLLGTPTLKLRGDYLAIVTLGFGEIIRIFLNNLNAPINFTNGPQGVNLIDPFRIGGFSFASTESFLGITFTGPQKYYYMLLLLTIAVIVVNLRLQNSKTRSPPKRWASTRATSSFSRSRWAPRSAASPAPYSRRHSSSSARKASACSSRSSCSRWWSWAAWATFPA